MTVLKFQGKVATGDPYRVAYEDEPDGWIWIGERDLVEEVERTKWAGPVTVAIGDDRFSGDLVAEVGWGYSEFTPVDSDELKVGAHNILEILAGHEGEEVTVWVADEPVDGVDVEGCWYGNQPDPHLTPESVVVSTVDVLRVCRHVMESAGDTPLT